MTVFAILKGLKRWYCREDTNPGFIFEPCREWYGDHIKFHVEESKLATLGVLLSHLQPQYRISALSLFWRAAFSLEAGSREASPHSGLWNWSEEPHWLCRRVGASNAGMAPNMHVRPQGEIFHGRWALLWIWSQSSDTVPLRAFISKCHVSTLWSWAVAGPAIGKALLRRKVPFTWTSLKDNPQTSEWSAEFQGYAIVPGCGTMVNVGFLPRRQGCQEDLWFIWVPHTFSYPHQTLGLTNQRKGVLPWIMALCLGC